MKLTENIAYIRGLMEGLNINESTNEGKVLLAMRDLLQDLCDAVSDLDDDMDQVYDELDAMDEDMDELEEIVYGDFDDEDEDDEDDEYEDDETRYELTCPNCGTVSMVDEETLLTEEICCPNCGAAFDIEFAPCDCEECEDEDEE